MYRSHARSATDFTAVLTDRLSRLLLSWQRRGEAPEALAQSPHDSQILGVQNERKSIDSADYYLTFRLKGLDLIAPFFPLV